MSRVSETDLERGRGLVVRYEGIKATVKEARKTWECDGCPDQIFQGDLYVYVQRFYPEHICAKCFAEDE